MALSFRLHKGLAALCLALPLSAPVAAPMGGPGIAPASAQEFCDDGRVAGGCVTDIATFPWMVTLFRVAAPDRMRGHMCGGSVIAPQWVLTAAHCIEDLVPTDPSTIAVYYGSTSLLEGGRVVDIETIYAHPDYRGVGGDDIALLRLAQPIPVQPVRLATPADMARYEQRGLEAVVSGWGDHPLTRELGLNKNGEPITGQTGEFEISPVLMAAAVPIVDNAQCDQFNNPESICAGYTHELIDACSGDSGGPLQVRDGDEWVQIGLVSGGTLCDMEGTRFSTYTRVSAYEEFIRATLAGETEVADLRQLPDFSLAATFFDETVTSGFAPDPLSFAIQAGGELRARAVGPSCAGFIAQAPDVRLTIDTDGGEMLRFFVEGNADTTLVINQPDGRWFCNDDRSSNDLNPEIVFTTPLEGQYDIWVGTFEHPSDVGFPDVTLRVSELPRTSGPAVPKPPL
ncbi:MAG: serine protease [Hyphomicrobiaceae bacterium]|nr:serine protease [Hyphomicrobiaceae bacterium]